MNLTSITFDHLKYHYSIGSRDKHMSPDTKDKPALTITLDLLAIRTNEISSNKLFLFVLNSKKNLLYRDLN